MASALFQPITLRDLTLKNRLVISPMCQFSAVHGEATDWHVMHFGRMMASGAGLFILEATAVEPRGRITPDCLGLWSDETEAALGRALEPARRYFDMPIGIQLCHAGRKASTHRPFAGSGPLKPEDGAWETIGPSAVPWAENWHVPRAMTRADMDEVIAAFVDATRRADRLGFDLIELHAAHGYLLSAFLSPLANHRADEYSGSPENRMRFPLEVFEAVRAAWPQEKPLGVRVNGTDWHEHGITVDDAVAFARALKERGCDYIDVSSGGNAYVKVPIGPGYQVPYAERIKAEVGITTIAVGLITEPQQAEEVVASGRADMVAVARAVLNNPHWPWWAAEVLGGRVDVPWQYYRAATRTGVPPPYAVK